MQASARIEEAAEKMKWKTRVEVAKILPDDARITQAETIAATEADRAFSGWHPLTLSWVPLLVVLFSVVLLPEEYLGSGFFGRCLP